MKINGKTYLYIPIFIDGADQIIEAPIALDTYNKADKYCQKAQGYIYNEDRDMYVNVRDESKVLVIEKVEYIEEEKRR